MQPVLHGAGDVNGVLRALAMSPPNDGLGLSAQYGLVSTSAAELYNESGWDRQRGNTSVTFATSQARTATLTGNFTNWNARGVKVWIDVTAASGTGGLTLAIQELDPASGKYFTVLQSVNLTGIGSVGLTVYPGIAAVANTASNSPLSRNFRLVVTHGDATSYTYSVGFQLIL